MVDIREEAESIMSTESALLAVPHGMPTVTDIVNKT